MITRFGCGADTSSSLVGCSSHSGYARKGEHQRLVPLLHVETKDRCQRCREVLNALGISIFIEGTVNETNQPTRRQLLGTSDGLHICLQLPSQFVNGRFDSICPDGR